jgi:hypothetical protein
MIVLLVYDTKMEIRPRELRASCHNGPLAADVEHTGFSFGVRSMTAWARQQALFGEGREQIKLPAGERRECRTTTVALALFDTGADSEIA